MINAKEADADTRLLVDIFAATYCSTWDRKDIARDKLVRFAQAYLMMARTKYRPAAPSDGFGHIQLTKDELNDQDRLYQEAVRYAAAFNREEDGLAFHIGCSDFRTNRAFVLTIEAARLLASGSDGNGPAVRLLRLAIKEIEAKTTFDLQRGAA
jgi:hypothetical protein